MAEWVFCRHTHLDKWWPRVLKWFPVGVVDGTGHPSPLRGFSSLTAQHPVRFGTTGFLAPTQSNCRVDTMFLDQAASDDRRRERRSRGDPYWSLPMGIGVYGRMLAGPSTSSFKRVGENADPMAYRGCLSPSGCASGMEGRWTVDEGEEVGVRRSLLRPARFSGAPQLTAGEHLQPICRHWGETSKTFPISFACD